MDQSSVPQPLFDAKSAGAVQPEETPENLTTPVPPPPLQAESIPPFSGNHFLTSSKGKYIFIIGAVIFFIVILIIAFGFLKGFASGPKKPVTLTYWGLWEDKEILQPLFDEYRKKNQHITIDYVKMTSDSYREKLLTRSKDGKGPDIFKFHNTWLPEIKDVVSALPSSVMSKSDYEKTFYPIHKNDLKIGDSYYGIPLSIDGLVLVYNQSLFDNVGITQPPASWEDVLDYLGKLTVKDGNGQLITSAIALGTASNVDHFSDIFGLFLLQNGAKITDLDQEIAASALESYRKFAEPGEPYWDETMPSSINAFIQEKVAMIIIPSWQIPVIKKANPDLQLKVAVVPSLPGSKPLSVATYWVDGVSKYSQNQVEAWKFLTYLSGRESETKLFELQSKVRLFGEPYSRVDLGDLLLKNEYLQPVIKQADAYRSIQTISKTYDNGLNDEINQYLENAINQTVAGVTYEQALKTAKEGVDQVLTKFEITKAQ
ncbi:MAG: sugar ABC transporter substrate-binding protein [Patescibacteria group bacterium]